MRSNALQLGAIHVMAIVLTAGCLLNADPHSAREMSLLLAGMLMVVVVGTLKDLYLQIAEDIRLE